MKYTIWGLVLLLILIHQDFWFWDDSRLVFGFMPIGLVYHAGISIAASLTWLLATVYAWPEDLAQLDPTSPSEQSQGGEA